MQIPKLNTPKMPDSKLNAAVGKVSNENKLYLSKYVYIHFKDYLTWNISINQYIEWNLKNYMYKWSNNCYTERDQWISFGHALFF